MTDHDTITLFEDLTSQYPMAAAGLVHDLCDKLSVLLEDERRDKSAIANACEILAHIFRIMDRKQFPDSFPWDAAYDRFGRWLMRGIPQFRDAVISITDWSDEQVAACKTRHIEMVRIYRDDWNRAANAVEAKLPRKDGHL